MRSSIFYGCHLHVKNHNVCQNTTSHILNYGDFLMAGTHHYENKIYICTFRVFFYRFVLNFSPKKLSALA